MAENGNRGPNDFRSRNVRRRREPPIIDASATDVTSPAEPVPEDAAPMPAAADATAAEAERAETPETAEPVLFGNAVRDAAAKLESSPREAEIEAAPAEATPPDAVPAADAPKAGEEADHHDDATPLREPLPPTPPHAAAPADKPAPPVFGARAATPVAPAARFGGAVPWLLGLSIFALLGALAWLLATEPQRSGRDEIADLRTKVAALEARPDPAQLQSSVAAMGERATAADAERSGLAKGVADLTTRLDAVAQQAQDAKDAAEKAAAAPAPAAPVDEAATAGALAALAARVDGLDARLGALSGDQSTTARTLADLPKPAAPDFGPVDARVGALDGRLTALEDKVNGADARLNGFDAKVNGVDGRINGFDARMNGFESRSNGLEAKLNDEAAQSGRLRSTVASLPKVDLAPLQTAAAALDDKVAGIEGRLSAAKDGTRATEARAVGSADEAKATPIALVGQSIGRAVAEGRPYAADLDALKGLGAEPEVLAKLAPLAATGAPTLASLKERWEAVEGDVLAAVKPAEAGSALDRFAASARALVQVRRVGAVRGDDPAAVVSQIDGALAADDVPGALAAWAKLPQAGQDKSQDWAAAALGRSDAEGAARDLVARSIATLGRTKS